MTQNISSLQSELLKLFNPKQDEHDTQTPADTIADILVNPETTTDKISLQGGKNISEMVGNILAGGNKSNQKPSETISDILLSNSPNNKSDDADTNAIASDANTDDVDSTDTDSTDSDADSDDTDTNTDDSDSDDYISLIHEFRGSPKTQLTGGSTAQTVKIIPFFPYVLKA